MFQHIRSMHLDRISNPTIYMEHIRQQSVGFEANDKHNRNPSNSFVQPLEYLKSNDNESKNDNPKQERDSSEQRSEDELNSKHPIENGYFKQEDLPTDLSNKKTDSKIGDSYEESNGVNVSSDLYTNIKLLQKISPNPSNTTPEPLRCSQCGLILSSIETFRDHLRNHVVRGELQNFVCFQCGVTSINQAEYELHVSSHFLLSSKEYNCSFGCNKQFSSSDDVQKHLFESHAQNVWKCCICFEMFESKVAIQIHFAMSHSNKEDTFRCSACMEIFDTDHEFKNHVRTQHSLMFSLPNLQCSLCRTVCSSELEMHFHMATHSKQYHHCVSEKDALVPYKIDNLNNNMFEYNYAAAKKLYPFCSTSISTKVFDPFNIQATTSTSSLKLPPPLYEFYDNIGKSFSQHRLSNNLPHISKSFSDHLDQTQSFIKHLSDHPTETSPFLNLYKSDPNTKIFLKSTPMVFQSTNSSESHKPIDTHYTDKKGCSETQFHCNICECKDFQSELELLTHQKVAHNFKTGVSLMCAYCNDNFRSRYELYAYL